MPITSLHRSGRGATWIARLLGVQEVGGSNPLAPTLFNEEPFGREVEGLFVFYHSSFFVETVFFVIEFFFVF